MVDIEGIVSTIADIKRNKTSLDILLEFEGILDRLHIYAYENWIHGEVIKGPIISKYWVEIYLMYPKTKAPNEEGFKRLLKHGCLAYIKDEKLAQSVKISTPFDLVPAEDDTNRRIPKTEHIDVCVIKIVIPKHLLNDYNLDRLGAFSDEDVNLDELVSAYEQGFDVEQTERDESEGNNNQSGPPQGGPAPPPPMPGPVATEL